MMDELIRKDNAKERAISCKTLICFLQSLIDELCDLELKNDIQLTGQLISVDCGMNVELKNVIMKKPKTIALKEFIVEQYDYLYLKGEKIRYVQFNDQINIEENINRRLDEIHHKKRQMILNRDQFHHKQKQLDLEKKKFMI